MIPVPSFLKSVNELAKYKDTLLRKILESEDKIKSVTSASFIGDEKQINQIILAEVQNIVDYNLKLRNCENKMIEILELVYVDIRGKIPSATNNIGDTSFPQDIICSTDPNSISEINPEDLYIVQAIKTIYKVPPENIFVESKM